MAENQAGVPGIVLISGEPHDLLPSQEKDKFLCTRRRDKNVLKILPTDPPTSDYSSPGADGAYERCTHEGEKLIFAYNDDPNSHPDKKSRPHVHVVSWQNGIPVLS